MVVHFFHLSQGRVRQQQARENKDQKQRRTFPVTFYFVKPFKNQFFGVHKGPPHASGWEEKREKEKRRMEIGETGGEHHWIFYVYFFYSEIPE